MPQNIEIKARVHNAPRFVQLAGQAASGEGEVIHQPDTFCTVPSGRLKLHDFGDGTGELIRYHRPNTDGPKTSDYAITRTEDPRRAGCISPFPPPRDQDPNHGKIGFFMPSQPELAIAADPPIGSKPPCTVPDGWSAAFTFCGESTGRREFLKSGLIWLD